jgi:MmyB-like transcription regulator ligand binding domain
VDAVVQRTSIEPTSGPVLPMHFRKGEVSLRLFTTIATLGTPQDVTLQELRIECFFPMDEPTAGLFRSWAAGETARSR